MKQWPEEKDETVWVEDLLDPVKDALEFAYDLQPNNHSVDIPYRGYMIGKNDIATCFGPVERLSYENINRDNGRDALDEILLIAFQLGIEQGRRNAYREDPNFRDKDMLRRYIKVLEEDIEKLKQEKQ
jgi:hypothetical protein